MGKTQIKNDLKVYILPKIFISFRKLKIFSNDKVTCVFRNLFFQQLCRTKPQRQCPKRNCWGTTQQQDNPFSYDSSAPPPSSLSLLGSERALLVLSYQRFISLYIPYIVRCFGVLVLKSLNSKFMQRNQRTEIKTFAHAVIVKVSNMKIIIWIFSCQKMKGKKKKR